MGLGFGYPDGSVRFVGILGNLLGPLVGRRIHSTGGPDAVHGRDSGAIAHVCGFAVSSGRNRGGLLFFGRFEEPGRRSSSRGPIGPSVFRAEHRGHLAGTSGFGLFVPSKARQRAGAL